MNSPMNSSVTRAEVALLKSVRELLTDPTHWTQRAYARDKGGCIVGSEDPRAVCWCLFGALLKLGRIRPPQDMDGAARRLAAEAECPVSSFNDSRTHADVLRLLDRTIRKAEAEGAC